MIKTLQFSKNRPIRCYDTENVTHVQSNLAVTPSEMNQMRLRGIPISSNMDSSNYYDGDSSPIVSIDPMLMRGIDINDAWNAQQSARKNLLAANQRDIKVYGK